ncbi:HAD family phosphatase [Leeia sp. TBRC 13508]|uniref:HAD family phosphatase n=1 Tax=Leeia speluncae TaxID=2884804 RepID=A0ABS8DBC7_9NEIS|nr:HAD family phosphatase [Leeia speluncae]MCB6185231.1 HAD family phosphatase [Leeia speluncae]
MTTVKISAVLFDMDGLMLDTEVIAQKAGMAACADFGFNMTLEIAMQLLGRNSRDADVFLSATFGPTFDAAKVRERFKARYEEALFTSGIPVKPGLHEMLDWLEGVPLPKAVATSTRHDMACKKLESVNVLHRFPHLVGGDQVKNGKPSPDIFLEAAARLSVNPAECIVLEDSEAGVRAALAAGMMPIMIPDLKAPTEELLSHGITVCPNLSAAVRHIAASGGFKYGI